MQSGGQLLPKVSAAQFVVLLLLQLLVNASQQE